MVLKKWNGKSIRHALLLFILLTGFFNGLNAHAIVNTFKWTDGGGNNNWWTSSNWSQSPGSGDYPGQKEDDDIVKFDGSKWGSGGTGHFDMDFTTSSSPYNYTIGTLDISTDGSTDNWRLQTGTGSTQPILNVLYTINTLLDGNGNASMDANLRIATDGLDDLTWNTSGNNFVLNGNMLSKSDTTVISLSGTGGLTLNAACSYSGTIAVYTNTTLDIAQTNALQHATVDLLSEGILKYIANSNIGALEGSGNLTLGTTLNVGGNDTSTTYSGSLSGSGDLHKKGTGVWTLKGSNTHTGTTYIDAGQIKISNGNALKNSVVSSSLDNPLALNVKYPVVAGLDGTFNQIIDMINTYAQYIFVTGSGSYGAVGVLSGRGGLVINMTGSQELGSANTFTGGVVLQRGTLVCSADDGIGGSGSTLFIDGTTYNPVYECVYNHTQTHPIQFSETTAHGAISVDSGKFLNWSATISGGTLNLLQKTGSGQLELSNNANTYNGQLELADGYLILSSNTAQNATLVLDNNNLYLDGDDTTLGALSGSGNIETLYPNQNLIIGGNDQSTTYSGTIASGGTLTKQGSGTLVLSGMCDMDQPLELDAGTVELDGDLTTAKCNGVNSATDTALSGNGYAAGALALDGDLAPSNPAGGNIGTIRGSSFALSGNYRCDVTSTTNDLIESDGALTITNTTLIVNASGLNQSAYIIASYNSLQGPFARVSGIPTGYKIDYAYNDGTSSKNIAIVQDNTPPTLHSITALDRSPTNATSVSFGITFSEDVTGVDASDFNISFAGTTGTPALSGGGANYTLTIPSISGSGSLDVSLALSGTGIEDLAGNGISGNSIISSVIIDQTAPVITLNGSSNITLVVGDTWTDPGATATDNLDTNVMVVVGGDTVNTISSGTFTITYDATDSAGNSANRIERTVLVITPFAFWVENNGLTAGEDGPNDDPDHDGRANFYEFGTDGNPKVADLDAKFRSAMISTNGTNFFSITFPALAGVSFTGTTNKLGTADGISYAVQGSHDLPNGYNAVVIETTPSTNGMPALTSTNWRYHTLQLETGTTSNQTGFLSLKLQNNP